MHADNRKKIIHHGVNCLFAGCLLLVGWVLVQLFFIASFHIPSHSMEPVLKKGDYILVWKGVPGARLFNIFDRHGGKTNIYHLPGARKVERDDVLVFNAPYPFSPDKLEMHLMKYYVKRCLGLPGDTLTIQNGIYRLNGLPYAVKYNDFLPEVDHTYVTEFYNTAVPLFPSDSIIHWDLHHFGPLYIPRKGDTLPINRTNYLLYRHLIEWEQQAQILYLDSTAYLNNQPLYTYTFQADYYFMQSDYGKYSHDSRYWGLLPEDFIVGKAWTIWKSKDPFWGNWRWDRFLKKIE